MISRALNSVLERTLTPAVVGPVAGSLRREPSAPAHAVRNHVWNERFDAALVVSPLTAGLFAAAILSAEPRLFPLLLFADLWFLGYHHVVATYTRLAFDSQSLRRNRFLAIDLLLLVVAATALVALTAGAWVVATVYLYFQWFHYMRQSYGISRMYFRTTPQGRVAGARDVAADLVIYLVPIYGIAARSATLGEKFLFMPVKPIVLPQIVIALLGISAAIAMAAWLVRTAREAIRGEANVGYIAFLISHIAIFFTAYIVVEDANAGWLAINIWHNLQYVLVVWMVNAKRYAGGVEGEARFLSAICQPGRAAVYFLTCLAISTIVYFGLNRFNALVLGGGVAATLATYMGINFHHYMVDAFIWKRRRVVTQAVQAV